MHLARTLAALSLLGLLTACGSISKNTSPDVNLCTGIEIATDRLFLQQLSATSTIVKWRGDADSLCYGTDANNLTELVIATTTAGDHKEAQLSKLTPDTTYHYSVGGALTAPAGQVFNTAPAPGNVPADGNTRILILGDSGTATEDGHGGEAAQVLAGYEAYSAANGGEAVDLLLALGDNAYVAGTDAQWQVAFFAMYADILQGAMPVTTIGNHEMGYGVLELCLFVPSIPCGNFRSLPGTSYSDDHTSYASEPNLDANGGLIPNGTGIPYLDIFTLPDNGQSGGSPSGTEQYYSIDYGNVHVVSLDTQLTARDDTTREAMRQWLIADLSANSLDWTVVIFHHPPYTKGANHDSDDTKDHIIDRPEWDIRNDFTPVFEDYGVDVVYSGHSHSYERSYYLNGHTGTSDTFDPNLHAELNAANQPSLGKGADTYAQLSPTSRGVDDRVVYTVAGSGGKADSKGGTTTTDEEWLRHAAHIIQTADTACGTAKGCRHGLGMKGSVVLDATASELTAKFVDVNGAVIDNFTITR
jgi:hypothetical protein